MATPNLLCTTNLSLDDIHDFVGGTSGTTAALDDSDIRSHAYTHPEYDGGDGLSTTSGTQIAIGEFRGASDIQVSAGLFPFHPNTAITAPDSQWGNEYIVSTTFPQAFCYARFRLDTANNRIQFYYYSGDSSASTTTYTTYQNYTNCEGNSVLFQCRCNSDAAIHPVYSGASSTSISGTFNQWIDMTNATNYNFSWFAEANSTNTEARIQSTNPVYFQTRIRMTTTCGDYVYYPTSAGLNSSARYMYLRAVYGQQGGPID